MWASGRVCDDTAPSALGSLETGHAITSDDYLLRRRIVVFGKQVTLFCRIGGPNMSGRWRAKSRLIVAALAVVLSSCGTAGDGAAPADFSEIAVGTPVVTPVASGLSATLTVSTSVDAVCAVAYGETEALGALATDQDMGGAGHSDHSALLTGLMPDTEYFYRLQGIGPDGRLFQSELLTFTTPYPSDSSPDAENLAVGADVVEVSSEFSRGFVAGFAVDGDLATEWSSAGDGDDAFITIDLGRTVDVTRVGFNTRSMGDGSATTNTFSVTANGVTHGPFGVGEASVAFTAQVIRFDVASSTGGNTGALEISVYSEG